MFHECKKCREDLTHLEIMGIGENQQKEAILKVKLIHYNRAQSYQTPRQGLGLAADVQP